MSLVNTLKNLKSNLFGGPGNTGFSKPPPSKVDGIGMTKTPTSSLDSDPLRFGTYQFPKDVFENGQLGHYMVFYVNQQNRSKYAYGKVKGYNGPDAGEDLDAATNGTGLQSDANRLKLKKNKITGTNKSTYGTDLSASSRNSLALQGLGAARKTTTRITDSIALYLPANVIDQTTATYEDAPTGLAGKVIGNVANLVTSYNDKDYEAVGDAVAGGIKTFAVEALRRIGAGAAEGLLNSEGIVGSVNKLFGQADNPFVEVLFTSMNVRKFTYNFNFAPRNEAETMEVQQIIQLFRFHMAPELQGNNARYLTLPSTFDIHYMYKANNGEAYENDYFTRLSTCVLQDCNVNYTPGDKVRTFADGAPTQITMSLTFSETEVLTKERINEGY
jgi:hypothetical protein